MLSKDFKNMKDAQKKFHVDEEKIAFTDKYISDVFFNSEESEERKNSARLLSLKYLKNTELKRDELTQNEQCILDEAECVWNRIKRREILDIKQGDVVERTSRKKYEKEELL